MPAARADAFLSGHGIAVPLREVEKTLEALWPAAAEQEAAGNATSPTVTRLVLANLVVADLDPTLLPVEELLDGVSRRYPSRILILRTGPGPTRAVHAEVSALCHLPAPGRPQVCSERIVLSTPASAHDLFPGAVRPLLLADLPMVLLWRGDPRPAEALFSDLADESSRLVLDLPDPGTEPAGVRLALDLSRNLFERDLAWFGITPWRELVAQGFDLPGSTALLDRIEQVHIEVCCAQGGRVPRVGLWLVGWLAGQLGWRPVSCQPTPTGLAARFAGPHGAIEVEVQVVRDPAATLPRVEAVRIEAAGSCSFALQRVAGTGEVRTSATATDRCALPRVVHAPEWDAARRLAAALESARDDPPYRQALPHVLRMLEPG